ncbi:unnamed protein product [Miscanthus lutarioriparius]|uniref:Uncharacterized protein n=1 Tax=Miscanthus lutarioriparius TaxID=422564 RepID=A0A811RAQ0_9POAL|nr:unnamed protein product [Miscanthus lutarioriparius]
MQLATANASLFKEKVLDLIVTCESFEISDMVQKEVLKEEITRRNSYVDELKDKLNAIEIENRRLKVDLNGDFTLLGALQTEVDALEKQTLSLAKDCLPPSMLKKEAKRRSKHHKDGEGHGTAETPWNHQSTSEGGVRYRVVLEQERLDFNSNLQDARKQIEMLKLKEILDSDASDVNYERMMKDIQLDLVQTPSRRAAVSHGRHRKKNSVAAAAQSDDKMLAMWSVDRVSSGSRRYDVDLRPPQSEAAENDKGKKRSSSEPVVTVKDLSVDKQEVLSRPMVAAAAATATTTEPHREWKKKVIDRLSSEAQRLRDLRSIVQELRAGVEASSDAELDGVKAQMADAEDAIAELIDANTKLLKKAEEFTSAGDGGAATWTCAAGASARSWSTKSNMFGNLDYYGNLRCKMTFVPFFFFFIIGWRHPYQACSSRIYGTRLGDLLTSPPTHRAYFEGRHIHEGFSDRASKRSTGSA